MITVYYKNTKDKELRTLEEFISDSWVHVEAPTEAERKKLADQFSLEPTLLEDAVDIREVPRVELEDGIAYIFTRFVYNANQAIKTAPMLIVVKKDCIITISPETFPRLKFFMNGKVDYNTVQKNKLLIRLFEHSHYTFNDYLNSVSKKIQNLTIDVEKIRNRDIIQLVTFESILNDVNTALIRTNAVLTRLENGKIISLSEEERDLLDDVYIDNDQLIQITQETLRNIINIRDSHSIIMTHSLNRIIKLFTSLTVILTVPTILGTFFGMNVPLPFADHPLAFFQIVILSLAVSSVLFFIFYRKDWL